MVGEETFLICMGLSILTGILLGFAIGYRLKERAHSKEIESIIRIAKRVSMAKSAEAPCRQCGRYSVLPGSFCPNCGTIAREKERAPKSPIFPDHPNRQPC
jgi:ribosomal protein L32